MGEDIFKDPLIADLYNNLVNTSVNDPYEDALHFLEHVRSSKHLIDYLSKLRFDVSTLISSGATPQIIERHMKFILMVQFEYTKSLPSCSATSIDYELSTWAAVILERLRICLLSRSDWKDFIKKDLVDRFSTTHGKTLAQIYLNIGLEPPQCLPQLDVEENDCDDDNEEKVFQDSSELSMLDRRSPDTSIPYSLEPSRQILSPRSSRISIRNSLPRALFSESVVVSSEECSSRLSTSQISPESSSIASTSYSQSISHHEREYSTRSKGRTPAPQLVLIPASKYATSKSKRKARTPVKRGSAQFSRSTMVEKGSKSRTPHPPSRQSASRQKVTSTSCIVSSKSMHRSVTETPNPKMSYPRWERARIAAAEKTKNRSLIVAESPLKPSELGSVLSSPLRRLRRASSFLNFSRNDSSGGNSVGDVSSSATSSQIRAKAEQWQRRQLEEEASLSQFSGGGEGSLLQSFTSSGSSVPSIQFQRRSSNLLANLTYIHSPQSSIKAVAKPILTSVVSSPPMLNMSRLTLNSSRPRPPQLKDLFQDVHTSLKSPTKGVIKTSVTTPKRRKTSLKGQSMVPEVPASPHIFDEAAMFLGEGEFLQHSVTDLEDSPHHHEKQPPAGDDSAFVTPKKRILRLPSPDVAGDDDTVEEDEAEVMQSRYIDRLGPAANTRSAFSSEAFEWSPCAPSTSGSRVGDIPNSHRVIARRTTPRKGLFGGVATSPRDQGNVEKLKVEIAVKATSARKRLRARRSLFK